MADIPGPIWQNDPPPNMKQLLEEMKPMADKKALIVLVVDHDTYTAEAAPPELPLDNSVLISFGREANDMASHWLGYEGWMVIADAPEALIKELGFRNLPLSDGE